MGVVIGVSHSTHWSVVQLKLAAACGEAEASIWPLCSFGLYNESKEQWEHAQLKLDGTGMLSNHANV